MQAARIGAMVRLIADMPSHRHAVCQARERDALGEVRPAGL